jgi:hypothetical protein
MVVAALFEQILPSSRGLTRDESVAPTNNSGLSWHHISQEHSRSTAPLSPTDCDVASTATTQQLQVSTTTQMTRIPTLSVPATRQRRKRFRATKCLASLAADFDVATDWIFYFHCRNADRQYREEYYTSNQRQDDQDQYNSSSQLVSQQTPHLIPPILLSVLLVVCILGTILWLTLATDGAVASPILRRLEVDKISMGWVLFLGVLIEDIPQVILTCLVEDYFEEDGQFTSYAIMNVISSLYDTLIKLAEAFDERSDIVETGIWCKKSIWGKKLLQICGYVTEIDIKNTIICL